MRILKKLLGKEKNEPINSYEDFWNWFIENEKKFFNVIKRGGAENISLNFFDKISPKLDQLKEGIWYLTGMVNDDIADLILTSDGNIKNYYLIEELIAAAPKLPNWKVQAHKPSSDIDDVAIDMGGFKFRKENIFFYENEVKDCPDEIDITIIHKDYSEKNKDEIINGCYIFLENFLGELEVVTIIDNIEFTSNEEQEKELVPIEKLKDFLIWREKEFVEKYDGVRYNTSEDSYISLETKLKNLTMNGDNQYAQNYIKNRQLEALPDFLNILQLGMTPKEVKKIQGVPKFIDEIDEAHRHFEMWTYSTDSTTFHLYFDNNILIRIEE